MPSAETSLPVPQGPDANDSATSLSSAKNELSSASVLDSIALASLHDSRGGVKLGADGKLNPLPDDGMSPIFVASCVSSQL